MTERAKNAGKKLAMGSELTISADVRNVMEQAVR
jgi:hypothetical protein